MEDCPICFEPCQEDYVVTECCGKHFHTLCHSECMKTSPACPLCRTVLIQIEPEPEPEPVVVPVKFTCRCRCCCPIMLCWVFLGVVVVFGIIGVLVYCIATKKNFPVVKKHINGTTTG